MERLLEVLPLLAEGDRAGLLAHCGVDAGELAALVTRLRRLDPKPGAHFEDAPDLRRAPDLIAERDVLGQWHVELNSATAPRIAVNAGEGNTNKEALSEARWLERTVAGRNSFVLDVAALVLAVQQDFLERGPVHLKPLSCADVAEKLAVHETTVNRVRNGLLIQTPRGVLPLRAFFARGGAEHRDGSHVPAEAISAMIAELIAAERKAQPLTDKDLALRLAERGVSVSRRTVSNRRRDAGFPSAAQRRKE
jgi:RNA polymerase sigma-54 factor